MILTYKITALLFLFLSLTGAIVLLFSKRIKMKWVGMTLVWLSILLIASYISNLWIYLEREPIRTLGETRLLYTFFLPFIGMIIYFRWKLRWMPLFSVGLASVFIIINLAKPENFDKTLMPALQSVWFAPHVIVYIFAYALLGTSTLIALKGLYLLRKNITVSELSLMADNIVYAGFAFLTFGLLFGALWAKKAWGNYWTWDPKETWAFLTWLLYLLYVHFRYRFPKQQKTAFLVLALAFVVLMICWFGINYLPSAQNSIHVYSQ